MVLQMKGKEKMDTDFVEIINQIAEQFGVFIDWGSANIVPYLYDLQSRIVKYKIATCGCLIILFNIIGIIIIWCTIKIIKNETIKDKSGITAAFISFLILDGLLLILSYFTLAKCFWVPEVIVLNFLQTYM